MALNISIEKELKTSTELLLNIYLTAGNNNRELKVIELKKPKNVYQLHNYITFVQSNEIEIINIIYFKDETQLIKRKKRNHFWCSKRHVYSMESS